MKAMYNQYDMCCLIWEVWYKSSNSRSFWKPIFVPESPLYFAWFQIFYSGDVIFKWGMRWRWKWAWKVLIIGQSRHCLIGLTMKLTLVELRSSFVPMLQSISGRCTHW